MEEEKKAGNFVSFKCKIIQLKLRDSTWIHFDISPVYGFFCFHQMLFLDFHPIVVGSVSLCISGTAVWPVSCSVHVCLCVYACFCPNFIHSNLSGRHSKTVLFGFWFAVTFYVDFTSFFFNVSTVSFFSSSICHFYQRKSTFIFPVWVWFILYCVHCIEALNKDTIFCVFSMLRFFSPAVCVYLIQTCVKMLSGQMCIGILMNNRTERASE